MKTTVFTMLFALLLVVAGCESTSTAEDHTPSSEMTTTNPESTPILPVEDGFYLILNEFMDSSEIEETTGRIIAYSHDFLDENEEGQPHYLEIDPTDYVGLNLGEEPEGIEQPDERINLMLTLTDSSGKELEEFSAKNVDRHVCIVIGEKAVTMHKIREKITGGKLQITRCTDNACEHLLLELKDNYSQK